MVEMKRGSTVYDRNGRTYEYRATIDEVAIVHPIFSAGGWEGEIEAYPSELAEVLPLSSISPEPPTAKIVAEVLRAENELARLKAEIAAATTAARNAEKSNAERLAKLTKYAALSRIEDFLEGRMTHFVMWGQYSRAIEIKTFDEVMLSKNDNGRLDGDVKLLSLFGTCRSYPEHGNKDGDLLWRVNRYRDGSGTYLNAQPCASEDEAKEIAANWLNNQWDEHRAIEDRAKNAHWLKGSIESAQAIGLAVPDDIVADFADHQKRQALAAVQKAQEALDLATANASAQP
ncbi:MAG: hypothetical protein ACRCYS_19245 [Beijerinckiaceae bacterium]